MDALLRRRSMMGAGGGTSGVVFYDRLVFDGTAYINTGVTIPANGSIRVSIGDETQKVAQRVFTADTDGRIRFIYATQTTSTMRRLGLYYDSTSVTAAEKDYEFSYTRLSFFMTPNGYGVSSNFYSYTKGNAHPTGGLQVGGFGSGQPFTGTMGTIRIYGSDAANVQSNNGFNSYTPSYTLRPCTYNGEVGLWCVETSTFYGNSAGAGALSVSNDS